MEINATIYALKNIYLCISLKHKEDGTTLALFDPNDIWNVGAKLPSLGIESESNPSIDAREKPAMVVVSKTTN